jgi:hypothetical protein
MAHIAKRRPAPHSNLDDIEAARQRAAKQFLSEAKRIHREQLMKRAQQEAR